MSTWDVFLLSLYSIPKAKRMPKHNTAKPFVYDELFFMKPELSVYIYTRIFIDPKHNNGRHKYYMNIFIT